MRAGTGGRGSSRERFLGVDAASASKIALDSSSKHVSTSTSFGSFGVDGRLQIAGQQMDQLLCMGCCGWWLFLWEVRETIRLLEHDVATRREANEGGTIVKGGKRKKLEVEQELRTPG
jgi:hypothetical protein